MDKQQTAVKNFLMKAYYMDERINSKLEQVASLNELAIKATSTMSDMPGSPNRNIHKTEDIIVKILDLQREIQEDANELLNLKQVIEHHVDFQFEVTRKKYQTLPDHFGREVSADGEMGADRHNAEHEHEESVPAP